MFVANDMGGFDNSPATLPIGLPADTESTTAPWGLGSSMGTVSNPPALATLSPSAMDYLKSDAASVWNWLESGVETVYGGTKKVVSTVYHDVEGGVETVVGDVAKPVEMTYWYALLALVVIAGGLYFVGKGGIGNTIKVA